MSAKKHIARFNTGKNPFVTPESLDGWRERAECNKPKYDPEIFFPLPNKKSGETAVALKACEDCPVRRECLREGYRTGSDGIWGGTTEPERRKRRREELEERIPSDEELRQRLALRAAYEAQVKGALAEHGRESA